VARNRRILELSARGLGAASIKRVLDYEHPEWALSAAGVRTVVWREKRR
jgi:hypothetical protein